MAISWYSKASATRLLLAFAIHRQVYSSSGVILLCDAADFVDLVISAGAASPLITICGDVLAPPNFICETFIYLCGAVAMPRHRCSIAPLREAPRTSITLGIVVDLRPPANFYLAASSGSAGRRPSAMIGNNLASYLVGKAFLIS